MTTTRQPTSHAKLVKLCIQYFLSINKKNYALLLLDKSCTPEERATLINMAVPGITKIIASSMKNTTTTRRTP